MRRSHFILLNLLFIASGASGLIYEVVWVRYLSLVIGHTTFAVSLVVSAFLAGLVLGSWGFGRLADRTRRPLLFYALLEASAGALGLGVSALLANLSAISQAVGVPGGGPLVLRVVLTFGLILPPTVCMGGTLPMLTRFVVRDLPRIGRHFGILYSVNTLGAALGTSLAGFWAIANWGLFHTCLLAAAINGAVALGSVGLFAWLSRRQPGPDPAPAPAIEPGAPATAAVPLDASQRRLLVGVFALAGFASISYEVLWFRVLGLFMRSSVYAFTVLMTTFLLGLVMGGLIYATWFSRRGRDLELLSSAQLLIGFLGLLSMALLGLSNLFWSTTGLFLFAAAIILVPASVIGVVFPLVVQLTTHHLAVTGRNVGLLYSVNTLGGIVGSLMVGFALIPWIGTQGTFELVALLNAILALLVLKADPGAAKRRRRLTWVGAALVPAAISILPAHSLQRAYAETPGGEVLEVTEGRDGTLAVIEYRLDVARRNYEMPERCLQRPYRYRQIRFGSVSYASTIPPGLRYMSTLAHLPMLSHPNPRRALVVCFGTGITAGTFSLYPQLESLVVVDLNPDVIAAAHWFEDVNHHVLSDRRTEVVIDDGRRFLARSDRQFDVISFEPPPPSTPGTVSLYTREFYRLVAARLAPGGILAQWIPMQDQPDRLSRMLLRSLADSFDFLEVWIPARDEAVILASAEPLSIDLDRWRKRWRQPALQDALEQIGFSKAEDLAGFFFMDTATVARYTREVAPVTDDRPAVEYSLHYDDGTFDREAFLGQAISADGHITGAVDSDRLTRAHQVAINLLRASALRRLGEYPAARQLVERNQTLLPLDSYQRYLLELEYDCLVNRNRIRSSQGRPQP